MRLLYSVIIFFTFSFASDEIHDNQNILKRTISSIKTFQYNKSHLIHNVSDEYLSSLSRIQKEELYDSLKQNIPLNMLLTSIVPTTGHFRIDKGSRGLKIVGYGCLAFALPFTPFVVGADVNDGGYLLIAAAFLSIPISYSYLIIDSGIQTAEYNNKIKKIIFKTSESIAR